MTTASTEGVKKKKPPTFQHYPANKAKKLKQAWIDKTKLKSKWKAEKKKEGLVERSKLGIAELEDDDEKNEGEDEVNTHSDLRAPSLEQPPKTVPSIITPSETKTTKHNNKDSRGSKRKREQPEEPSEPQSLRDLTREAYSRSTLHTFKSHPLKKGKTAGHQPLAHGEKGRGQPNMKLRMNAMLAKIKQDLA